MPENTARQINPEIDKLDHAICACFDEHPITPKLLKTAWRCFMKENIEAELKHEIPWEMLDGYFNVYWRSSFFLASKGIIECLNVDDLVISQREPDND